MAMSKHPHDPSALTVLSENDVQCSLHVHVLISGPPLDHDRQFVSRAPEMRDEYRAETGLVDRAGLRDESTYDVPPVTSDIGPLRRAIVSRRDDVRNR
jgi:hypothetical protein